MTAERGAGGTSWQRVSDWYGRLVGREGSYYHRQVILPHSLKLLDLRKDSSLLELACGQGVLARYLPEGVYYQGVDSAPDLLEQARRLDKNKKHRYTLADASKPLPIPKKDFTHAVIILALQNIPDAEGVVRNPREHLKRGGRLLVVLNHPCFRIPRQSSWGIDLQNQLQYRRIDRYLSPQEIPIRIHPGRGARSESAWSYHLPLSEYSRLLYQNGFVIERIEEWVSDKESQGKAAKMENRARREFPLFLALLARRE
ncbi:MAG: class I SAM-dependent methyltransferase [Chloroflexota bacterium]